MKCNVCNAEIADNAKFCTVCGAKVEEEIKCPNCGATISKDAIFCTECGYNKERERKCAKCGSKISDGGIFCTNCGAKIDADSDKNNSTPVEDNNNADKQAEAPQTFVSPISSNVENKDIPKDETNTKVIVSQLNETPCNTLKSTNKSDSFDAKVYESVISNIYKNAICVIFVLWGISVVFSFIPYIGNILTGLLGLVWFGFYIYYIVCLGRLIKVLYENDVPAIKKLRLSSIIFASLPIVAIIYQLVLSSVSIYVFSLLNTIAAIFVITFLCIIISSITLRIISFWKLKNSITFSGRQGANTLFIATITLACSLLLSIIGGFIGFGVTLYMIIMIILVLVALIMTFIGWKRIKEAAELEVSKESTETDGKIKTNTLEHRHYKDADGNEIETIVCPNRSCGKEVNVKFEECPFCGTSLKSQESTVES
ncbi:MAG: zinc-ribbon domain-containing protein [Bacteroidales bacterium]|nr:zinc-ribbon domain-containing protein [Bacteroidales bacterium]